MACGASSMRLQELICQRLEELWSIHREGKESSTVPSNFSARVADIINDLEIGTFHTIPDWYLQKHSTVTLACEQESFEPAQVVYKHNPYELRDLGPKRPPSAPSKPRRHFLLDKLLLERMSKMMGAKLGRKRVSCREGLWR